MEPTQLGMQGLVTEGTARRPMRRMFGVLAGLLGAADLTVAAAVPGNAFGIPTAAPDNRSMLVAYGLFLLAVSVWAMATAERPPRWSQPTAQRAVTANGPTPVLHALRESGWYVADDVHLPHADVDHVVVGPAGVLAVQVMRTDAPDPRGRPHARARIAAQQLRRLLHQRELDVDVVPAVVAWGPGLDSVPGGVRVMDSVAILLGEQADEWLAELVDRRLLPPSTVEAVRSAVSDVVEGTPLAAPGRQRAMSGRRVSTAT